MGELLSKNGEVSINEERASAADASGGELIVEDFISKYMFFQPYRETAAKILGLNEELSENYIEKKFDAFPLDDLSLPKNEKQVTVGNWMHAMMQRVSSLLFHEDESDSGQASLTDEEAVEFFQKLLSERIYNRLSMLSRSPHAKKGKAFSIKEELGNGMAVNIGLGLYRHPDCSDRLRREAEGALFNLAWEFQYWLLNDRKGVYTAPWGQVRDVDADPSIPKTTSPVVLMIADVKGEPVKPASDLQGETANWAKVR